jgi:hypothetical protein
MMPMKINKDKKSQLECNRLLMKEAKPSMKRKEKPYHSTISQTSICKSCQNKDRRPTCHLTQEQKLEKSVTISRSEDPSALLNDEGSTPS